VASLVQESASGAGSFSGPQDPATPIKRSLRQRFEPLRINLASLGEHALCIEAEKELQVLGCGWRIVTSQFRGSNVLVHHNGNTATMKRTAF